MELTYLVEKRRVAPQVLDELRRAVSDPSEPIEMLPLSLGIIDVLDQVLRAAVPDMPDRIIAATALANGLPLVSGDRKIRSAALPRLSVVW